MRRIFASLAAVLWASVAVAADKPDYAPAPGWVQPIPIPKAPPSADGAAVQLLLQDAQSFYGLDGDQFYSESAIKVLSPQALFAVGNIALNWNPETEALTIHRLAIIRGDQVIDLLAKGVRPTVLRRETNLELAMLDGDLTATFQPEDLRVGDVVDLAFTLKRHDPVYQGRSEGFVAMARTGVVGRVHFRALWPSSKPVRWRAVEGLGEPVVRRSADQVEVLYDLSNSEAPKPPLGAPARFNSLAELQVSQFADWSDVSALMAPLYRKAATLPASSPLRAEIDRIKAASTDPKTRAAAALHLVQDQTRYVFLGMNFGGYVPADAEVTWSRRFGDCKGKTALLLSLLWELGIDAEPALVNSSGGDGLDEMLPELSRFDHVLVRAVIAGKTYWLDGTRLGDRGLDDLQPPDFIWALPLAPGGARLERIDHPPLAAPEFEDTVRLDASAGLDAPAPAHIEYLYRGDEGISLHLAYSNASRADTERTLRESWTKAYPWITVAHVDYAYDDSAGVMRLTMDGSATMDWRRSGTSRYFEIGESNLGWQASFKREPGPHQDAPFKVAHPVFSKWTVNVVLPKNMHGFTLTAGQEVDRTIAGVAYKRASRIENGVAVMEASERSLAPEFPAAEAEQAAKDLRQMSDENVFIRSPPVAAIAVEAPEAAPAVEPVDGAGFSARGVVELGARAYDRAIADFTRAIALEPTVAKHRYNRGVASYEKGLDEAALADFNEAVRLNSGDVLALMARGEIYLRKHDDGRADQDFDAAAHLAPGSLPLSLRRIRDYERAERYDAAIRGVDKLIAQPPPGADAALLLNQRCWIRAESGRELPAAQSDCVASLKLKPDSAPTYDSLGLVMLRMKNFDEAITDYGAALRLRPTSASSLYGRGIAELRKHMTAQGQADLQAAAKLDPKVGDNYAGYGIKP
jgi:tetratricopeptide (TPR) repeat protein